MPRNVWARIGFRLTLLKIFLFFPGIVSEGTIHIINPGKVLAARGTKVDDENAHYLLSVRIAAFLPYENGLMAGEDTYTSAASTRITKLKPEEVVTTAEALA